MVAAAKKLLQEHNINSASNIEFDVNGKIHSFTFEEIIKIYAEASKESQLVFLRSLQKALEAKEMGAQKFFEGMGKLLLMSHLSQNFKVD